MTKIKLNSGNEVDVNKGDVLFVTLTSEDSSVLVRGSCVDFKSNGKIVFSVLNPKLELEKCTIASSRVVKVERAN